MRASIRTRLILLVLIIATPLIVSTLLVIQQLASEQADAQRKTIVATTRALASAVDAELQKYAAVGYSLSTSSPLKFGNYGEFHEQATKAVNRLPGCWVVVADVNGQQIVNTLRQPGTPLPLVQPMDIHQKAMRTGADQIGDILDGPVAGKPAVGIFVPILEGGEPKYDIIIGLDAQIFARLLQSQGLPNGWVAGIGDRKNNFVARSIENDRFVKKQISQGWLNAARGGGAPYFKTISQEGILLQSAYTNLSNSDWTVSIGASEEILEAPHKKSLQAVGLASASLLFVGICLAWFAARPVVTSMKSLQEASEALIQDRNVALIPTGFAEVDQAFIAFDRAISKIRERERHQRILIDELNHRVKNTLAVVQSLALLARQTAGSVADFTTGFISRIVSLARTHDLLTEKNWDEIDFETIVRNELAAFHDESDKIAISGPRIRFRSKEAISIGMIVHELATNAAKYGVLSSNAGYLQIVWATDPTGEIGLTWEERGGPPVIVPDHRSFGTKLINTLAKGLGGKSQLEYLPSGVRFNMKIPSSSAA